MLTVLQGGGVLEGHKELRHYRAGNRGDLRVVGWLYMASGSTRGPKGRLSFQVIGKIPIPPLGDPLDLSVFFLNHFF